MHITLVTRLLVLSGVLVLVASQPKPATWTTKPFSPPAYPLAVRTPYLNTWLPQGPGPTPFNVHTWPNNWNLDNMVTSWYASVVVDGIPYRLIGVAPIPGVSVADQIETEFTPTRTSVQLIAGPIKVNVSFISPIEPTDLVRQSLPFSYMAITASSVDGRSHSLQIYSDISGEFISGDTSLVARWSADDSDDHVVLSIQLQTPMPFEEINEISQDGTAYYSLKKISNTTTSWAIAEDTVNRAANGSFALGNEVDTKFRAISTFGNNQPVLGIAVDWGQIVTTPEPAVWALGVVRSPSVQYTSPSGSIEERYPYFLSAYNDASTAARTFLDDFQRAVTASGAFDAALTSAGNQLSPAYADLLSLAARQVMGCLDITVSKTSAGGWNTSDVKIFMKNMGSAGSDAVGTFRSVNTVDILYAAFPAFMYLNPELGKFLLAPLLEYQDSSEYTLGYAAKNIGSSYPNATADGLNDGHDYGVEETANMLIMVLAYSQASRNITLPTTHYSLLKRWAEYLVDNSLTPTNQRSADFDPLNGVSTSNQTNLAIKGIIAIGAMSRIAEMVGVGDDAKRFNDTATSFIREWQNEALAPDQTHIKFFYEYPDSSGLIYNVYADKMLQLGLVPDSVYDVLTNFYQGNPVQNRYGIPLNGAQIHNTSMNWMMFAASAASSPDVRNLLIAKVHNFVVALTNFYPLITNYDPASGDIVNGGNDGINSPAQGAMFSLLALGSVEDTSKNGTDGGSTPPDKDTQKGTSHGRKKVDIITSVVVSGLVLCAIVLGFLIWRRKTMKAETDDARFDPFLPEASDRSDPSGSSVLAANTTQGREKVISQPSNRPPQMTSPLFSSRKPRNPNTNTPITGNLSEGRMTSDVLLPESSDSSGNQATREPTQMTTQSGTTDIRAEVESLRREIEHMRQANMSREGPPPCYSDPGDY